MIFGGQRKQRQRKGRDLQYELNISFEEAAFGATKEIEFEKLEICDECNGTGAKN